MSSDVSEIILENIPGALTVTRAHEINDRNGTDFWVEHCTGRHLSIDLKSRRIDYKKDDLALETWSVIEKEKVGWTRDETKRCDYIMWFWQDTKRWAIVPFPLLCRVFIANWMQWREEFKWARQETTDKGVYHSECVFVPRRQIWAAIYRRYSGNIAACEPGCFCPHCRGEV